MSLGALAELRRRGQDPPHRRLERVRRSARARAAHGADRLGAEPLQPDEPRQRARDRASASARASRSCRGQPLGRRRRSRASARPPQTPLWPGCCSAHRSMLPIPGTTSIEHLEENVTAAGLQLTGCDRDRRTRGRRSDRLLSCAARRARRRASGRPSCRAARARRRPGTRTTRKARGSRGSRERSSPPASRCPARSDASIKRLAERPPDTGAALARGHVDAHLGDAAVRPPSSRPG